MATNLRANFSRWIVIFVVLPTALSMALCIFFFFRLIRQNFERTLTDEVVGVSSKLEHILRTEAVRLKTLSSLPSVESLITIASRRATAGGQVEEANLEKDWAAADRTDMIIRSVLDSDVAILLRDTCEQNEQIRSLLLCDGSGALLASSARTPSFYQDRYDWWSLLHSTEPGRVLTEGIGMDQGLGLALPRISGQGTVVAVVREELEMSRVLKDLSIADERAKAAGIGVFIVSQTSLHVSGVTNAPLFAFGTSLAERVNVRGIPGGWADGFRYRGAALDSGLYWARPVWVIAAQPGSRLPLELYGPLAVGIAFCCVTAFAVFILARHIGQKLFFEPMREAAEAGLWVLTRAAQKLAPEGASQESYVAAHPWIKLSYDEKSPQSKELDQWMDIVRNEARDETIKMSIETQRDMDLVRDFQQAFLNRAPPRIPAEFTEGKLRVEFSHVYKPGRTVGSDFFAIDAVDADCAGLFICDVMGHGTQSAMLSSTIRALLNVHQSAGRNPAQFMKNLNGSLCDILRQLPGQFFASACYFAVDAAARMGAYSLAGFPAPVHLHRSVRRINRMDRPKPRGAALGSMADEDFGAENFRLMDDDIYVLYTDGSYEASNRAGQQFGISRLEKSFQAHINDLPDELLKNVYNDIEAFCGSDLQADDICLVAIHVTSKPPAGG